MAFTAGIVRPRFGLAAFAILTAALIVVCFFAEWGPPSPDHRTFDLITPGMTERQVYAIVHDWQLICSGRTLLFVKAGSRPGSWSIVAVDLDEQGRVIDKRFEQGGKSSLAQWAERLMHASPFDTARS